jgi:hypothetical protein
MPASAAGTVGLGVNSADLIFSLKELAQNNCRKLRRPSENNLQRCSHVLLE